jgi:hypothetical protein
MPRHPADDLLEPYVRGSTPPPGLVTAREKVERRMRMRTDTASHDLSALESEIREQITALANEALKDKLKEARENSKVVSERIWQFLLAVGLILIGALLARVGLKP